MDADRADFEQLSAARVLSGVRPRKLAKVPFVELADGRLQGVVSSGSDIARVYVSTISAGTHSFSCSTNNNRPCGGVGSSRMCKHLDSLLKEAVLQYGVERIAGYLKITGAEEATTGAELSHHLNGSLGENTAAIVFSRFLSHLAYLEVGDATSPIPELHWFPATGAV